jgi:hypothetical protein
MASADCELTSDEQISGMNIVLADRGTRLDDAV